MFSDFAGPFFWGRGFVFVARWIFVEELLVCCVVLFRNHSGFAVFFLHNLVGWRILSTVFCASMSWHFCLKADIPCLSLRGTHGCVSFRAEASSGQSTSSKPTAECDAKGAGKLLAHVATQNPTCNPQTRQAAIQPNHTGTLLNFCGLWVNLVAGKLGPPRAANPKPRPLGIRPGRQ